MALAELIKSNSSDSIVSLSTEAYKTLNFIEGSFPIILFLLSTTLNPIVFYQYWKLPSTVPNLLYRILAIVDFVVNVSRPILLAFGPINIHTSSWM